MDIVFIGYGEAAYHLSQGLRTSGDLQIGAFDANVSPLLQQRAEQQHVTLFDTLESACRGARFVVCLTSASSALGIAQKVLPLLVAGQTYVDMNSAAPSIKQAIDQLPRADGVGFCDAAVMGTVPGNNHRVPMLLAGSGAAAFAEAFTPRGMQLSVLDADGFEGGDGVVHFRAAALGVDHRARGEGVGELLDGLAVERIAERRDQSVQHAEFLTGLEGFQQ